MRKRSKTAQLSQALKEGDDLRAHRQTAITCMEHVVRYIRVLMVN